MNKTAIVGRTRSATRAVLVDVALVSAAAALLMLPSLMQGAPTGHDYPHHAVWVEAFTEEQSLSRPYPRWLSTLWFGAGGADFFFYAPLAYWLAGAMRQLACTDCGPSTLLAVVGLVALVVSGLGFRALGLRFAGRRAALVAALVYMALPYHLGGDWYHRLALAEFTAMAVLPWHLAAFVDCLQGRANGPRLALLTALLALSHLPTVAIAAPTYLVLLLVLPRGSGWRPIGTCAVAGTIGLGLAALYWYPAVALLDTVRADLLGGVPVALVNLIAPINFDREPYVALLSGPFAALSAATLAILLAAPKGRGALFRAVVALLGVTWVMATPLSLPLWKATPLVAVQYPWRFLTVSDLAFGLAALLAVATLSRAEAGRARRGVAGGALGAMLAVAALDHPLIDATGHPAAVPNPRAPVLAGAFEWLPRESAASGELVTYTEWRRVLDMARQAARGPELRVKGAGAARVLAEGPRVLTFEADLPAPSRVVVHRTHWRLWRLENLDTGAEIGLAPTDGFPLVSATLPAGRARYRLALPTLREERLGALISAAALAALLAWWWFTRPRRRS